MTFAVKKVAGLTLAAALLAGLTACGGSASVKSSDSAMNNDDFYEVHHEGRIYYFDDAATYKDFLANDETPFRLTRIAAGANGETLVFGLAAKDKKKTSGIAAVDMIEGKLAAAEDFYGEIVMHDRYYVFSTWADMKDVRSTGEAPYRFTEIGAGPGGKTVVYVLNPGNKKKKPTELMSRFKAFHGL